jgi:hypothetical protein
LYERYAGWDFLAVEAVNGANDLLVKNSSLGVRIWHMDSNWNLVSVQGVDTSQIPAQETIFGVDADGNGTIEFLAPTITVVATDANAGEPNDSGQFILTRTDNYAQDLTVNYTISGTAMAGVDHTLSATGQVTFAAGSATALVDFDVVDDNVYEGDETVILTLITNGDYGIGSSNSATVTIQDDDPQQVVNITANGSQIGESSYTYNGHTYLLTTTPKTWEEAQLEAQQYGGNLVTINDTAEEQWLKTTFGTAQYLWIGLTDKDSEGNFVWVNGEPVSYTNWSPSQPDNWNNEDYVHLSFDGKWNDLPAYWQTYGIIEVPSTQGQFTLTRVGNTDQALTVNYSVSGTARNGFDYSYLGTLATYFPLSLNQSGVSGDVGTSVTFEAGSDTATINVDPLPDNVLEENETVVVTLEPNSAYQLGTATTANLAIADNTTYPTQGYLKFDGVDDQFVIADQDAIDFDTNQNFTVEVWFKADSTQDGGNSILEKWWSGNGNEGYPFIIRYHHDTGIVYAGRYDITNNPVVQSTTAVNDNKWHHLAFIKDGKTLRLYIDGNEEASSGVTDTTVNTTKNPSPVYVGSRGPNSDYFAGGIDDLRIWNVARTQAEIQMNLKRELQGNESGLVGYWKLNGTANDWTSNQNHGSLRNNPTWYNERLNEVTIAANDADVSEANNPGQFTLTRTGDLSNSLTVYYSVSGTATNGTDYNALTGFTTFAAGSSTALVNINPIDDPVYELNETVTLTLATNGNYNITNSNSATVTITNNDIEHLGLITDFNKDGKSDILWRYLPNGAMHAWAMNGANSMGDVDIEDQPDAAWYIVGTGDFNNDGNVDLLLRYHWWDNTGSNVIWLMNGNQHIDTVFLDRVADNNWHIVGTGDFNKDGNTDILWRYIPTGQNHLWTMQGTTRTGGIDIEAWGDLNERIVATGDFNGDGNVDILWRNFATGNNTIWFMNGMSVTSKAAVSPVGLDWHIMGAADFNNDGKSDIIWRNFNGGQNVIWLMDGVNSIGSLDIPDVPDRNWTIVGKTDPVAIWTVDYFGNADLAGAPTYTEVFTNIHSGNFSRDWGEGAPPNTPVDYFSGRMKTDQYFAPGSYKINLSADNGVRLWIGSELVIDQWGNTLGNHVNYFTSSGGYYSVTIEYQEYWGLANVSFSFEPGTSPPPLSYYGNIDSSLNSYFSNTSYQDRSIQDKWDRVGGESAQFPSGNFTSGDLWKTDMPSDVYNIYKDLSNSIFGSVKAVNTGYAYDYGYYLDGIGAHSGIDIQGVNNVDQVKSAVQGKVVKIVNDGSNGYWIAVDELDGSGNKTGRRWWYGHLSSTSVSVGSQVNAGQTTLGKIGLGHLHLTVVNTYSDTVNYGEVSNGKSGNYTNDVNYVLGRTISPLEAYWKSRNGIKE